MGITSRPLRNSQVISARVRFYYPVLLQSPPFITNEFCLEGILHLKVFTVLPKFVLIENGLHLATYRAESFLSHHLINLLAYFGLNNPNLLRINLV